MTHYTYMITNNINGKVYVGSHSWSGEGIDKNYYGSGTAIKRAVKKYGKENFQVEVLYYYSTVEECRKDEERILTEYNVKDCPYSYNCKNSAIGWDKGLKHSEDAKRKISEAKKGRKLSDETRKKLSQALKGENNPMYGKNFSEEHRKNLSQALKGRTLSEKQKDALLQANNYRKIPVVAIQKDTGKIRVFESQWECARQLNLYQSNISQCLKGMQKTHKGYTFKYVEQLE